MATSSRRMLADYNVREKIKNVRKHVVGFVEKFAKSFAAATVAFIEDMKHMLVHFATIVVLYFTSIVLYKAIVEGGPLLKLFLDLISLVILTIYDAIGVVFGAINSAVSFFGGGSPLPNLPEVSPTYFFQYANELEEIPDLCREFNDPWYGLFYPARAFMSPHTCYWLRYLYPTLLGGLFMTIFGWASFDPTPDLNKIGGNCQTPEIGEICYVVTLQYPLGDIIIPWYWIAMVVIHYRIPILMIVFVVFELLRELIVGAIVLVHKITHHRKLAPKTTTAGFDHID